MNAFPFIAAFTACVSIAILTASFDDLREAPLTFDARAERDATVRQLVAAAVLRREATPGPVPTTIGEANEGLLDHELASADPVQAWLDRYLTPPAK